MTANDIDLLIHTVQSSHQIWVVYEELANGSLVFPLDVFYYRDSSVRNGSSTRSATIDQDRHTHLAALCILPFISPCSLPDTSITDELILSIPRKHNDLVILRASVLRSIGTFALNRLR